MIIDSSIVQSKIENFISSNLGSDYQYYLTNYDKNFIKYKINDICHTSEGKLFGIVINSEISALGRLLQLQWDSSFFNFKVAKITDLYGTQFSEKFALLKEIKTFAKNEDYKLIVCRVDASDISSVHALEQLGFKWVDGMNIFLCDRNKKHFEFSPTTCGDENISVVTNGNHDFSNKIQELVLSFAKKGRLNNDPRILPSQVERFYLSLFDSLVKKDGSLMLVSKKNNKIVGFALGVEDTGLQKYLTNSLGYLWMISVDKTLAGQGVGRRLFKKFINTFSNNMELIEIGTQMNNYEALNLYSRGGMKMISAVVTMHLWL